MSDALTELARHNKEMRLREEKAREERKKLNEVLPEPMVIGGLYQHYKGGFYVLLSVNQYHNPNTLAGRVVSYVQATGDKTFYREVVGTDGFFEAVFNKEGVAVPRFKFIKQVHVTINNNAITVEGL